MSADLTVVVPVHDPGDAISPMLSCLERALDPGMQVILVDDASTDDTPEILAERADRHGWEVIRHDTARGASAARNTGMAAVTTPHVMLLDADDTFDVDLLRVLDRTLTETGVDLVRTDHLEVRGRERRVRRIPDGHREGRIGVPRESILPAYVRTAVDHPNVWAGAMHRRLLERGVGWFPEDLRTAEDRVWTWELFLQARSFTIPNTIGVHYRRDRPGSLSRAADERQLDFIRAMDAIIALLAADPEGERFLPKAIARTCELVLHHLAGTQLTGPLERTFRAMVADHFDALPAEPRDAVIAGLRADRRARLQAVWHG